MFRGITVLALLLCNPLSFAEPYAWPLDLPRVLTSSFAEYRPGRYHMAIDLRTGPAPQPVRAASDGYVSRIRCSPYGYGKVVYLQLADGNTVVYAHLSDFAPHLREYVQRVQHDRRNYTVNIYPEANRFPVAKGEIIAHSGETGIGVPHLHYELRDRSGVPINPREIGIEWPDAKRPIFNKLLVIPLTPESRVNGGTKPVVVNAQPMSAGEFRTQSVRVAGPVAFGVDVADYAESSTNRLGVYRLSARDDSGEWFRLLHDRVSYEHSGGGRVAYYPYPASSGRFLLLYRWPGNDSEIFAHSEADGAFDAGESLSDITIEATDFLDNTTTLEVPLAFDPPVSEPAPPAVSSPRGNGTVDLETRAGWLAVTVTFNQPEPEKPVLVASGSAATLPEFRRLDDRRFIAGLTSPENVGHFRLNVLHPRLDSWSREFLVPRGKPTDAIKLDGLTLSGGRGFGPVWITAEPSAASASQGLRPLSPAVRIWPDYAPLDEALQARFTLPANAPPQAGLFRRTSRGWSWVGAQREGDALVASLTDLGEFRVMADETPPRLEIASLRDGQTLSSRRPTIRAVIDDSASGIADWRVTANGNWLLFAYDPERKIIEWEQDEALPAGPVDFVFTVTDEAGNVSERTVRIQTPAV